jgi:hypothetical protein
VTPHGFRRMGHNLVDSAIRVENSREPIRDDFLAQ